MTAPATALRVPPGDPGALADAALELDQAAHNAEDYSAETATEAAAALNAAEWTGDAANGFRAYARAQEGQEERVSPALRQIAGAMADYATELHRVQEQARAGIALAQGSAHQPSPDPTSYDAGLAEVSAAWARYETAADEAAARIRSAEAALPAPDAVRHPQPAPAPVPWYDKVGDWFEDRADDVERELHDAVAHAKEFLEYLAEHPDAVKDLSRDGALLVFGAFLMALGASAEGAGLVLVGTGGGTPGGIALTLAGAEALIGGFSIAGGALAAAKDLGKAYADSGGGSPSGGGGAKSLLTKPSQIAARFGYTRKQMEDAIHEVKSDGLPRDGPLRNPDIGVDPASGEVYVKLPGGGFSGDSIGNIFDYLPEVP